MRSLLALTFLLAAGCAPAPTAPPASAPPAAPSASGSAQAPADPARPDAAVIARLARLAPPGPLDGALDQASRDDLTTALNAFSPDEKAALPASDLNASEAMPLLVAATAPGSEEALAALCGGRAWRALRKLRPAAAPADDLPLVAHNVARWSALALGRQLASPGRAALSERDVARVVGIAAVLQDHALMLEARRLALTLQPGEVPRLQVALAAVTALDPVATRESLAASAPLHRHDEPPPPANLLRRRLALLDQLVKLGDAQGRVAEALGAIQRGQVSPEAAAPAAALVARLGRFDLVAPLLTQGKVAPESDLRAAVALVTARLEGSSCQGLERSGEPADVCPDAWRAQPDLAAHLKLLEAAFASGQGRDAWSLEAYLGYTRALPLTSALHREQAARRGALARFVTPFRAETGADFQAFPAHEALALVGESLLLDADLGAPSASAASKADEAAARRLVERALALRNRHRDSRVALHAALTVSLLAARAADTSALLMATVPSNDDPLLLTHASHVALLGLRQPRGGKLRELFEPYLGRLFDPLAPAPRTLEPPGLLGREIRASLDPSAPALERLLAGLDLPASAPLSAADTLHRAIDQASALMRLGRRAEAEKSVSESVQKIHIDSHNTSTTDLLALLQTVTEVMLATNPDPQLQRRGMARLRDRLESPSAGRAPSAAVRLYRATMLRDLLDEGRLFCVSSEGPCRGQSRALRERAAGEVKALSKEVPAEAREQLSRGFLLVDSEAHAEPWFEPEAGLALRLTYTPRLVLLLPPRSSRPKP